ncbi:MAG: helix-turn-helix domain-containing protein [Bacilli bacterium]|jgi:transcriptional regulator with XRE-family HTH domain
MEFKETLKILRKKANLTQKKLAHKIGVSDAAINHWESGRNMPSNEMLGKLGELFEVSIDYLLGVNIEPNNESKDSYIDVTGLTDEEIAAVSLIVEKLKEAKNG